MKAERAGIVIGLIVFLVAVVEVVSPGAVPIAHTPTVITLIGLVLLAIALGLFRRARQQNFAPISTPWAERTIPTSPVVTDVDDALRLFAPLRLRFEHVVERDAIRLAALGILMRFHGLTEVEAVSSIDEGTWSDDAVAASYLRSQSTSSVSFRRWVSGLVERDPRTPFSRTVDELAAIAGISTSSTSDERIDIDDPVGPNDPHRAVTEVTNHWSGISAFAIFVIGIGLLIEHASIVALGVIGIGFAAYARSGALGPIALDLERSLDDQTPAPGDPVRVHVRLTNRGDRLLPDVRFIDGVPLAVSVSAGSPRHGAVLRPGESTEFSYQFIARRGSHVFEPATVVVRDLPQSVEHKVHLHHSTTIQCIPPFDAIDTRIPLRDQATRFAGSVSANQPGDGVEFHSIREYRPGDALSRVDWHRFGRTRQLATVQYDKERAATIVIVIDSQRSAFVGPTPDTAPAIDRAVDVAGRVFSSLLDAGHQVGIGALGAGNCWLEPSSGITHRVSGHRLLALDQAFDIASPTNESPFYSRRRLLRLIPRGAQVVVLSPLCNTTVVKTIQRFEAHGYPVTVLSPDPFANTTVGERVFALWRAIQISDLRGQNIPVIEWTVDGHFEAALAAYRARIRP